MTNEPKRDESSGGREASDWDIGSDPALDAWTGSDWTSDGGAAPQGPATDVDRGEESR